MKTKLIVLLCSLLSLSAFAGPTIIGGTPVAANDPLAKVTVGIFLKNEFGAFEGCTGVLITRNVVLTAAHCLINDNDRTWRSDWNAQVVFDVNAFKAKKINNQIEGNINPKAITRPIRHMWAAGYLDRIDHDDIALVYFDGDLPAGYEVAQLADNDIEPSKDSILHIAGYGISTSLNDLTSGGILRKGTATYAGQFNNGENFQLNRKSATVCSGDSGGPAFLKMSSGYLLYGIVYQTTDGCNSTANYSSVQGKRNWIHQALINIYKAVGREGDFKSFDGLANIYKLGKGTPPTDLNNTYWSGRCFHRTDPFQPMAGGFYYGEQVRFYWAPDLDPSYYDGRLYSEIEPLLNTDSGHPNYMDSLYSVEALSLYQGQWTRMRFFDGNVVVEIISSKDYEVMSRCIYTNLGLN